MDAAADVEQELFEVIKDSVLDMVSGVEYLHSKPKPLNLCLGWAEISAVVVVGLTALVLDFMAFRASELKKTQRQAGSTKHQPQTINTTAQSTNGHVVADSTTPLLANGNGAGGETGGTVVAVRPGRRPATDADKSVVQLKRAVVLSVWIVSALVCHRLGLTILARLSAMIGSLVAYLPHFLRSSKYRRDWTLGCLLDDSDKRRSAADMLVWTSFAYVVPSVYGLYVHQYGIAALQFFTTVGSTLFHLTRETKFFNLDNVFATSLLLTTVWGLFLAVWNGIWWYVAIVGLGGPFAIFCIVRCGMPGLVCRHPSGHGLCRRSNPEYDFFHVLWHLSSGLCTLISIHFFEVNFPAEEAGGGWFHYFPDVPVVPTVSLAISASINFYGNRVGVMPLN